MLKTYRDDIKMALRLIESIETFNEEKLPVYVVCPTSDLQLFRERLRTASIILIPEESMRVDVFSIRDQGLSIRDVGYLNQQIYKLAFSYLGLLDTYLSLDSDTVFVRPFFQSDFIDLETGEPFLFQSADRELQAESSYREMWQSRKEKLKKIESVFEASATETLSIHNMQVISSRKVSEMLKWTGANVGLSTLKDLISQVPYEFNWYTTWVRTHYADFVTKEPIFKTFHSSREVTRSLLFGIGDDAYSSGYVGVCINSNFQFGRGRAAPLSLKSNYSVTAGLYLSIKENVSVFSKASGAMAVSLALLAPKFLLRIIRSIRN